MKYLIILSSLFVFTTTQVSAQAKTKASEKSSVGSVKCEVIYYKSDTLQLKGYLFKPEGKGPFPVFMWNHDYEKNPDSSITLANFWVKQGYIFFKPIRSGQGGNPGVYICDEEKQINRRREMAQLAFRQTYLLHKKANEDVIAALQWIKYQPNVDSTKIVVAGYGYGGTQVLFTAEKDGNSSLGVKCFFAVSPEIRGWSKMWADSLAPAVKRAKRPILVWQARSDGDLSPISTLGPILEAKGFPNYSVIFQDAPPAAESINVLYNYSHPDNWAKDVLKFLKDCGVKRKKE